MRSERIRLPALVLCLLACSLSAVAEADTAAPREGLSGLDWAVIVAYALGMLAVGWFYSRRTETSEDYYLGGRKMKPSMVGLSLFATLISTISYLAVPGEMMSHGPIGSLMYIAALPIICVIVALGLVTVVYSSMGGLRAVVLTDAIQSLILFGGALLCVGIVTVKMGGFSWFPTEWSPDWDRQPLFSFDPTVRVTVFGTILMTTIWWVCTAGSDQMAIQRYLATRDVKAARRAFLVNNAADVVVTIILVLLGFALLGFFKTNPQFMAEGASLTEKSDYLFPHFVVSFMGFGLAGLVVSGMLAAAMSSLSSGVNSASTVINKDLVDVFSQAPEEAEAPDDTGAEEDAEEPAEEPGFSREELIEKRKVSRGKWISVGVGVAVILLGLVMGKVPGNLYAVTQKTNGLFVAPLFGLFFFAMFVRFATPFGATFGSLYGFAAAVLVAFWDLTGAPGLSFQYILAVSLLVDIGVGCLLSLLPYRNMSSGAKVAMSVAASIPLAAAAGGFIYLCNAPPVQ